ncbi:MAG: S41 family peptidase [Clostridia bacterium]
MSKKNKVLYVFLLLLFFVGGTFLGYQNGSGETYDTELNLEKIIQAYELVDQHHVYDEIEPEKMTDKAIKGLLQDLDRGYTRYLTKSEFESSQRTSLYGTYGGIGVVVVVDEGVVKIVSPYKGTPADRAGLKSGDIITSVNGESIKNYDIDTVGEMVRGEPGSEVTLTVMSSDNNGELKDVVLEREIIEIPFVEWELAGEDEDIAHVSLFSFSRIAVEQLDTAIAEALDAGAEKILLDLRGNPGGDLEATLGIADLFLDADKTVFMTQDVDGKEDIYKTETDAKYDHPMFVLVDHGSASASEVISGAIKENNRGKIIGYNTFGKASMQSGFKLLDESYVWITTHTYLTPDRNDIDMKGIIPNFELDEELLNSEDTDQEVLEAAIEIINSEETSPEN